MSEHRRNRSRSRERRHHSSHRTDDHSHRDSRSSRDDHHRHHSSRDRARQPNDHRQHDRRGERVPQSERRLEQHAPDAQRRHDHQYQSRRDRDERHGARPDDRHMAGGRNQAEPKAGMPADGGAAGPANGAAVLDAMVPRQPPGATAAAADGRHPPRRPRPGAPPGLHQHPAPGQSQQQLQQPGAAGPDAQPGAQQPVRINPHGLYARAIEETDYIVPRGGYFFEHDDRDVVTFKEELRRPRSGAGPGGAPGQAAAGGGGRGAANAGGSFIVEDPGDRWEDRGPPPPRQRGRDWADSEAAEPMDRQRRPRRAGASEGIFGLNRNSDFREGSWQGGRGRGSSFGGFGGFGGGGGKWSHDMFETLDADKGDQQHSAQS